MLIIGIDPGISGAICFFEDGQVKELIDMPIEDCIEVAYAEISNRTGKMVNGTYVKND